VTLNGAQSWSNNSNTQSLNVTTPVNSLSGATTLTIGGSGTGGVNVATLSNGTGTTALVVSNPNVNLTGNSTYTGTTTVSAGGVLNVNNASGGKIASDTTVAAGGTLALHGGNDAFGDTNSISLAGVLDVRADAGNDKNETIGNLTGTGTVTRSTTGNTSLTIGSTNNLSGTFSGIIQDGAGQLSITKAGTGTSRPSKRQHL
jgi:autotransporter-associated beta strand protein